ncbi:caspase, EACC1-associated type [Streptomyces sp. 7R007]
MVVRPDLRDPGNSAAVLVGVSGYTAMPKLPSAANNLTHLASALTDPRILGLPANQCVSVADPAEPADLLDPIVAAARVPRDLLIVYYAGHGFIDRHGALHLTVTGSRDGIPYTAVPYEWLSDSLLQHNRARRRVVILDCCYSGRALGRLSGPRIPLREVAEVEGSYLLTASRSNVRALAPEGEECTAFTGELVRVLREGVREEKGPPPPYLTLDRIYEEVRAALERRNRPSPQSQDNGQLGRQPFAHNLARPRPAPPPQMSRAHRALALGVVAALLPVTAVAADSGRLPSDLCSPTVALTGYSDRLDKSVFRGNGVYGLSSLALDGPRTMLSLADNSPPLLYRMTTGDPGRPPRPEITGVTTLLRRDGTPFGPHDFDGEALALERGGRTVLAASEAGPSVSRFDLRTGRLLADFPVPRRFRVAPAGEAVKNAVFESLALSPDGRHLYVGLEDPLNGDGTDQGRNLIRVLRYTGTPGGAYTPDGEFAYETDSGLRLADLVATGDGDTFLALERGFAEGQGNSVHVYETSFAHLPDVTGAGSLTTVRRSAFAAKRPVIDLAACPPSGARQKEPQSNPLLDNAEGIALGPPLDDGPHAGARPLYLITDDNDSKRQTTRFYALTVTGL